jgi:hypothetical protein
LEEVRAVFHGQRLVGADERPSFARAGQAILVEVGGKNGLLISMDRPEHQFLEGRGLLLFFGK